MFTNTDQLGFGPTDWHYSPGHQFDFTGSRPDNMASVTHYTTSAIAGIATGLLSWYGVRALKGGTVPAVTAALLGGLVGYTATASWAHPLDTWQNRHQMYLTNKMLREQAGGY